MEKKTDMEGGGEQARLRNEEEGVTKLRTSLMRKAKSLKLTNFSGRLLLRTQRVFQRNLGYWYEGIFLYASYDGKMFQMRTSKKYGKHLR